MGTHRFQRSDVDHSLLGKPERGWSRFVCLQLISFSPACSER